MCFYCSFQVLSECGRVSLFEPPFPPTPHLPHTQEATTLKRERDAATVERDKLQALLLKRNKEAALLYEKIRVLNDALYQGRVAHKQRLDEIRMLKIKVLIGLGIMGLGIG